MLYHTILPPAAKPVKCVLVKRATVNTSLAFDKFK